MAESSRRGAQGSIYAYETKAGTRYRFTFRDRDGKQTTKRGYRSRREAQTARELLMGAVHKGEVRVSRETLVGWWERWLTARRPYLEEGSWRDYKTHGERRILPHLRHRKLTAITAPELRDWLVELHATEQWAPKTLNNEGILASMQSESRRHGPARCRGALGAGGASVRRSSGTSSW